MSVKKLDKGYEVRYDTYDVSGVRHQHRRKRDTLAAARELDAQHALDKQPESTVTIKEYLDGWLEHVKAHKKRLTYRSYKYNVALLYKALETNYAALKIIPSKFRLSRLRRSHIQAVIDWLIEQGHGSGSVNTLRCVLSAAFSGAVNEDEQVMQRNPVKRTEGGGGPVREKTVYDSAQVEKLLAVVSGRDFYMPVFLASHIGLCAGECSGLRWKDIDLAAGTLTVNNVREYSPGFGIYENPPKTKKRRRTLPLPQVVIQELKAEKKRQRERQIFLGEQYVKNDYVCRRSGGRLYDPHNYATRLHVFEERAGLPRCSFHDLRHSCASVLYAEGVSIGIISDILGHSSVAITEKVYLHMFDKSKQQAAAAMDAVYGSVKKCGKNVAKEQK